MRNVFVISTEYHFILAMSIISDRFTGPEFSNLLVLKGIRSAGINTDKLTGGIQAITISFDDPHFAKRVENEIFGSAPDNLFVVHTYRAYETYVLSKAPKRTRIHLMQDGSLFYHTMEVSLFLNRIRETWQIYQQLWKKGILLKKLVWYPRHMHRSRMVDELWMTHPHLFVDPGTRLPIQTIRLFPNEGDVQRLNTLFHVGAGESFENIEDCMIYLAPIIREASNLPIEIEQIRMLREKVGKKNLLIKLHPGMRDKSQFNALQQAFGDVVIQNYVPAEMYIANARRSVVIGSASTALFFKAEGCMNIALKRYYQKLGIYAAWKNVALPEHVITIDEISDFDKIKFD